jgi:hypothetical protein
MGVLMSDLYQINVAKAEFREAYNSGNVDRLLALFADEFTDMSAECRVSLVPVPVLCFDRA